MSSDYDYPAMLLDAKAKRAALDAYIQGIETAIAAGARGQSGDLSAASTSNAGGESIELPVGAFLGKSLTAAIKLYMAAVKKKQTISEISAALKDGGVESLGSSMEKVVGGTLYRLKESGEVLRFKDGWALAEHYNESFRARLAENDKPARKRKKTGPKPGPKPKSPGAKKTGKSPEEGPPQSDSAGTSRKVQIHEWLKKNGAATRKEILDGTGIPAGTISRYLSTEPDLFENHDGKWSAR